MYDARDLFGASSEEDDDIWTPLVAPAPVASAAASAGASASSGSGDPWVGGPPLPPPPRVPPHFDAPRGGADVTVRLHGYGTISYYRRYDRFQGTCECHEGCKLSRSSHVAFQALRPARGRPVGFLTLWLLRCHQFTSKEEHHNGFAFALLASSMDERVDARAMIATVPRGIGAGVNNRCTYCE